MKASAERMSDTYLERFDLSLTWFDPTDSTNTSVSHISDLSTTDAARGQAGHKAAADVHAHVRRDANTHTDRILYAAANLVRVRGVQAVAQANPCSLSAAAEDLRRHLKCYEPCFDQHKERELGFRPISGRFACRCRLRS